MKKLFLPYLVVAFCLLSQAVFSQAKEDTTALLGLPGDNLDLYAVLNLFQKSKTIESFEKSLNDEQTKVNNLDLNLDKKIDFIKVTTKQDKKDSSFTFILQVDVTKTETQDVAMIFVTKEKGKISIQAVGDEELYGKDYVIEPKGNSSITANPGYQGADPVVVNVPATTTVVVQSAPIVQYVYSPAYVPYTPPYYYGFYPAWFGFATVMAVGIYRSNNWYCHGGYYGGHYGGGNNNVIINNGNRNTINHNTRNTSNTVKNNMANGGYGNRGSASTRPSTGGPSGSTRPSAGTSNRPSTGGPSGSTRPSAGTSNRPSTGGYSGSTRPSTSNYSSGRTRSSGGYSGGGMSGGGMRGGGGGGRRR